MPPLPPAPSRAPQPLRAQYTTAIMNAAWRVRVGLAPGWAHASRIATLLAPPTVNGAALRRRAAGKPSGPVCPARSGLVRCAARRGRITQWRTTACRRCQTTTWPPLRAGIGEQCGAPPERAPPAASPALDGSDGKRCTLLCHFQALKKRRRALQPQPRLPVQRRCEILAVRATGARTSLGGRNVLYNEFG